MSDEESRALLFGFAFWLAVLCGVLWWYYIRPGDLRLLIPSFWWIDPCALSPGSFILERCAADATVADTDSLVAAFLTFFVIMMLWIVQSMAVAAVPIVVYAYTERLLKD